MTKKLFTTVMVMALLLAGTALAGEIHYKVYGKAHVSTESLNNGDTSSIFVSSNSTRIGIKGKYATDVEWLNVVFQYESAADFNGEKANVLSSRDSFAGVGAKSWGWLVWGRHNSPVKTLSRRVDYFSDRIGDNRNVTRFDINYFDDSDRPLGFDERFSNMMMYKSPQIAEAIGLRLQYVPEEGKDSNMSIFSGSAVYDKKGLLIGVGYETHGKGYFGYDPTDPDDMTEASNIFRAIAGFTGERFSVKGLFETVSNIWGDKDVSGTAFGLGANYMVGPAWDIRAQYYAMDYSVDRPADAPADWEEPTDLGNGMLAIGVDYHLNESALIYLTYATSMNQDMAYNTPFRGGHGQQYHWDDSDIYDDPTDPKFGEQKRLGSSPYGIALGLIAKW